jgi:mRNA-degrading endonuclease RelE of RelBE toxin-antitoxin system
MYRVFRSAWYEKKLRKLDGSEQKRVEEFEKSLKLEPNSGKPLGYKFMREKKFNGKRLIYLIFEEYSSIFLVTITNKKLQQDEIDKVKLNYNLYKDEIIRKLKEI